MCDSVCHVLRHVFARQSHPTTSIVEWAVDFREGTFVFNVFLNVLLLERILLTFVGACDWIQLAMKIVDFSNFFEC
ncbi:hypothetical protein GBAR_LOCUS2998 [Geodia barretti]|uniref:Uncharacterized protein n=1 Tax=Geodia barretti TaxID=519541 RepID=A0AA35R2D2_GEOBA|nr:hypothetical protein GBAR_LOCUS2998 [Geodia barretti]